MTAAVNAFFDDIAGRGLWHDFNPEEIPVVEEYMRMWAIEPGSRVIEPGCGRGRLTELLSEAVGPNGKVVGVDISSEMIAGASDRGLPDNTVFLNRCFLDIPPEDGLFDYVVCCNVWPHFDDSERVIEHVHSLLRSGGHLHIAHLCGRERLKNIHREAGRVVSDHLLPPVEDLAEMIKRYPFSITGFEDSEDLYWLHAERE